MAQGHPAVQTGRHDDIRPPALLTIGHLPGQNSGETSRRHAGAAQHPGALQRWRRAHHQNRIAAPLAAGFDQQRDVENDETDAARRHAPEKGALGCTHQWMQDGLQPRQRGAVAENASGKRCAIDAGSAFRHAREGPVDGRDAGAARGERLVNRGIGVEHRYTELPEHGSSGTLAHADRAGKAEDEHRRLQPPSVADTAARKAGVTSGSRPNQAAKPGLA